MNLRYFSIAVCLSIVSQATIAFAVQDRTFSDQGFRPVVRTADARGAADSNSGAMNFPRGDRQLPPFGSNSPREREFELPPLREFQPLGSTRSPGQRPLQPLQQQETMRQVSHPEIRDELFRRVELDQVARQRIITSAQTSADGKPDPSLLQERINTDRTNRQWLAELLRQNNDRWIGKSMVGAAGSHAAWVIVQHSDDDPTFQMRCLNMMRQAPKDEVAMVDIAFLTDEVLIARNEKQKFGTQVQMRNGTFRVAPVEDPQNLNTRRAALGLESIEDYLNSIRTNYQARANSNLLNH